MYSTFSWAGGTYLSFLDVWENGDINEIFTSLTEPHHASDEIGQRDLLQEAVSEAVMGAKRGFPTEVPEINDSVTAGVTLATANQDLPQENVYEADSTVSYAQQLGPALECSDPPNFAPSFTFGQPPLQNHQYMVPPWDNQHSYPNFSGYAPLSPFMPSWGFPPQNFQGFYNPGPYASPYLHYPGHYPMYTAPWGYPQYPYAWPSQGLSGDIGLAYSHSDTSNQPPEAARVDPLAHEPTTEPETEASPAKISRVDTTADVVERIRIVYPPLKGRAKGLRQQMIQDHHSGKTCVKNFKPCTCPSTVLTDKICEEYVSIPSEDLSRHSRNKSNSERIVKLLEVEDALAKTLKVALAKETTDDRGMKDILNTFFDNGGFKKLDKEELSKHRLRMNEDFVELRSLIKELPELLGILCNSLYNHLFNELNDFLGSNVTPMKCLIIAVFRNVINDKAIGLTRLQKLVFRRCLLVCISVTNNSATKSKVYYDEFCTLMEANFKCSNEQFVFYEYHFGLCTFYPCVSKLVENLSKAIKVVLGLKGKEKRSRNVPIYYGSVGSIKATTDHIRMIIMKYTTDNPGTENGLFWIPPKRDYLVKKDIQVVDDLFSNIAVRFSEDCLLNPQSTIENFHSYLRLSDFTGILRLCATTLTEGNIQKYLK